MVMAPFTPFLAEELYRKLTGGESVHLLDWPEVGHINELVVQDMQFVREVITEGLAQRAEAGIKVRQPLAGVAVYDQHERLTDEFREIIAEELNIKSVNAQLKPIAEASAASLDLTLTPELKQEGITREVIRHVQQARKSAGLEVGDRISLGLTTADQELSTVLIESKWANLIKEETLAQDLMTTPIEGFGSEVKIDDATLGITLAKV
jgi:isoleucyl-tRNA synthetase